MRDRASRTRKEEKPASSPSLPDLWKAAEDAAERANRLLSGGDKKDERSERLKLKASQTAEPEPNEATAKKGDSTVSSVLETASMDDSRC